jgi:hypothetical protein
LKQAPTAPFQILLFLLLLIIIITGTTALCELWPPSWISEQFNFYGVMINEKPLERKVAALV